MSEYSFTKEQLDKLFPFYFEMDRDLNIVSFGKSLSKLIDNIINKNINDVFSVERPYLTTIDADFISNSIDQLFIIKGKNNNELILRGQFEMFNNKNTLIFIGSPWVQSIEKL